LIESTTIHYRRSHKKALAFYRHASARVTIGNSDTEHATSVWLSCSLTQSQTFSTAASHGNYTTESISRL